MLVNVGGQERTTDEYATLLARGGLRLARTISLGRLEEAMRKERDLRAARVPVTPRIVGDIIHADGGGRDLRNHLLAQRTPETFWEIDCLYRGIEA